MSNKKIEDYLLIVLDAINYIHNYVQDMSYKEFVNDQKTIDAVLMQFQHIGETFKKIKKDFPDFMDYPHSQIVGFRDIISHDYLGIDAEETWITIIKNLPELKEIIKKYIK